MRQKLVWVVLVCLAVCEYSAFAQGPGPRAQGQGQLASSKSSATPPAPDGTEKIVATDLICVVGGEHVLAGDVFAYIDDMIEEKRSSIPKGQEEVIRRQLLRRMLGQYVQIKAQYQDFLHGMIGNAPPSEAKEKRAQVETKANKLFYERQVPNLLRINEATDLLTLEEKLRAKSSSISRMRQQFIEKILASEAERKFVPEKVEILRDELIDYYNEHEKEWKKPARARWRELTARFDRFSTKAEAKVAIEAMGNEIYLGGKPFDAVAKASSQGYTATIGGANDWISPGGLKSKQLETAIFTIAPKRLSQVIEDDVGYHIIEVLEREEAMTVSFDQAHDDMREAITEIKRDKLSEDYRRKVMERTVIWTLWPEDIPGSRSLQDVLDK